MEKTLSKIHTQLFTALKAFHTQPFDVWCPMLDECYDLTQYLYRNRMLPPITDDLKAHCIERTKDHFLREGKEIGTEAVRKEMNDHYYAKVEKFLLVQFLESLDQEGADELLKKTKSLA